MRTNPLYDTWLALIGSTGDHGSLGLWKWFFVGLFIVLLGSSIWIAVTAWRTDWDQRTPTHLATWLMRTLVGSMWFQNLLWKLPLGGPNGLSFWTEQMAGRAAFQVHRDLVTGLVLPNFTLINPLIFLAELAFAVSLMLGLGVRVIACLAVPFVLSLWLGLYVERPGRHRRMAMELPLPRVPDGDVRAAQRGSQPGTRWLVARSAPSAGALRRTVIAPGLPEN
jgi:hypothetical protein